MELVRGIQRAFFVYEIYAGSLVLDPAEKFAFRKSFHAVNPVLA